MENQQIIEDLKDRDVCCWCSLDKKCRADVLIEIVENTI
jgi:hypothetical protein